ncbi:MAG: DUF1592 domain-containing protein, partial [Rubripirellula sp.]|nr:DUF1592 domain-containing protein [Rubripirellula sp.]
DPGPVILRRLSNAEYNYTLRDLTGIETLEPTKQFPVDGAAGEGFTNVGNAQTMSPSLLRKYLDAAKQVSGHAILLPRSQTPSLDAQAIRFSTGRTRRDWTDELLQKIRDLYGRYTVSRGPMQTQLPGVTIQDHAIGYLPVESYLRAALQVRDAKEAPDRAIEKLAHASQLSEKYLRLIWNTLNQNDSQSFLLHSLRQKWKTASIENIDILVKEIARAQNVLWKFNTIGHIGREGSPTQWMEPVSTVTEQLEIEHELFTGKTLISVLPVFGKSAEIRIRRPQLVFDDATPAIPLQDVANLSNAAGQLAATELNRIEQYLDALHELRKARRKQPRTQSASALVKQIATQRKLSGPVIAGLAQMVGSMGLTSRRPGEHLAKRITSAHGIDAINGWQGDDALGVTTNRSSEPIKFLTITAPPRSVIVHPSPSESLATSWQSPIDGAVHVSGKVADADEVCGNGYHWQLHHLTESGRSTLAGGDFDNGQGQSFEIRMDLRCQVGDLISLLISPRDQNHACDSTHVELDIQEVAGAQRHWKLSEDVVDKILAGNPLADSFGNPDVWHFTPYQEHNQQAVERASAGSALARWGKASDIDNQQAMESCRDDLIRLLKTSDSNLLSTADQHLRNRLRHWRGPLNWLEQARRESPASSEWTITAEEPWAFEIDPRMAGGKLQLLGTVTLNHLSQPAQLSVGHQVPRHLSANKPVLVNEVDQRKVERAIGEFRDLFPPMPCYARIVPVDEVVTLVLFHREDEHLKRLVLDRDETRQLDRFWQELISVSQEPLQSLVAFEQITAFATQDRPDLVIAFKPFKAVLDERARDYRREQVASEPFHLAGTLRFADRAWRRPLSEEENRSLKEFYQSLRNAEVSHEDAIRLTIARVLTSPNFLYRQEVQQAQQTPTPITDHELANRLSYFLWSSLPDHELRDIADHHSLRPQLKSQTQRMLQDARSRRLAVEFAMQWLHLRLMSEVEKNEALYPSYALLRESMLEEAVLFFEDMFRNDGSILDLLDADHTFLNADLAKHYGILGIDGDHWRRVDGLHAAGRGGVLSMAAVLASQSGVSRTSPILRGNWIYETLLGKRLPRPPANVPTLPTQLPPGLTSRQMIERHSSSEECAKCHRKIDPYGFALEQFDTVGRLRGGSVDTATALPDGTMIEGFSGLREYLLTDQRDLVVAQFCRKLLGYALGREVQLSDTPLLEEMHTQLAANDYRFHVAIDLIVQSRQFQLIRGTQNESHLN